MQRNEKGQIQTSEKLNSFHDPESECDKFPQIYVIHDNYLNGANMNFRTKDSVNFARNLPQSKEISATLGREVAPFIMSVFPRSINSRCSKPGVAQLSNICLQVNILPSKMPYMEYGMLVSIQVY